MTTSDSPPLLEAEKLGKRYRLYARPVDRLLDALGLGTSPRGRDFWALRGLDLRVERGESWGVIGENGAGKSTLLKLICGVASPTEGRVATRGRIASLLDLGAGFHREYVGRDNVVMALCLFGLSAREAYRLTETVARFADIGDFFDQPIKTYSAGMLVRLGYAVTTVLNPDLLVTDEVLAVGDEDFQKKCTRQMEQFLGGGGTLLLCTHNLYHVNKLCRRALWLHNGTAQAIGPAQEVTAAYRTHVEEREASRKEAARLSQAENRVVRLAALDAAGHPAHTLPPGATLTVEADVFSSQQGEAPVMLFGLVRADMTPIYGVSSDMDGAEPLSLDERTFRFRLTFPELPLLPGRYRLRAHALDTSGTRLYDTSEWTFDVTGETRELGYVRLQHRWL